MTNKVAEMIIIRECNFICVSRERTARPAQIFFAICAFIKKRGNEIMAKIKRNPAARELAKLIMSQYDPQSSKDLDEALKEVFGTAFEEMLQAEMDEHLGYSNNSKEPKETENRRNGYGKKTLKTTHGEVPVQVPRDRDGSFKPEILPKRQRDVSGIEDKVISMYARGMSQRDISKTIEEIYGFSISHEMVSKITDRILPDVQEWKNRPLKSCYAFLFVDCLYVPLRDERGSHETAVYVILGYDLQGRKEILGLWLSPTESKNQWMQIFDEIKARGVDDVFFISMDGVSGLEQGAKAVFPEVVVQRCIVHLIRNSIRYIPSKDYKAFTADLKKVYGAVNLTTARAEFEKLCYTWKQYPGAVRVWERNFQHVEQLFEYGSEVRRIMYTTNAIESVNASLRKVTKKGSFSNEAALNKALYLRIQELEDKWSKGHIMKWSVVLNQLMTDERFEKRIGKYLN